MTALRHLLSILILPGTVTLLVPFWILRRRGIDPGWSLPAPLNLLPPLLGVALLGIGLTLMVKTISLFVTVGRGTLAPWDPPRRLVVRGIYRHVRNPMISGVLFVLAGEALLAGSTPLLGWFALFAAINMVYIPLIEEPQLANRFGADYALYTRHVPRWLPRRRAWEPPEGASSVR